MFSKKRVYLDAAAGMLGNPSSPHDEGRAEKEVLDTARESIARLLEVKSDDVLFTSGATEANALAVLGVPRALRARGRESLHVLYLPSAHASIVENALLLRAEGVAVEPLPIRNGQVDIEALAGLLRPETVLISMEAVCGETGVIWNTREVATLLDAHVGRTTSHMGGRAVLHVDASQAPATEKLERAHFRADLLTFDGGKVGVRGVGVLVAPRYIPLVPLYGGGGQERGLRSGTENVDAVMRFAHELQQANAMHEEFGEGARVARAHLVAQLMSIPGLVVNEGRLQAPHILNISLPGRDTDYLIALLDEAGFAVASRSACETDSREGSRAVFALTHDESRAMSTLRISWGKAITERDLTRFARALHEAVAFVDSTGS